MRAPDELVDGHHALDGVTRVHQDTAVARQIDIASVILTAEAVGAMDYANKATLEYIKGRKQFGQAIGAFQALQHRMVDMTISAAQARSMVYLACTSVNGELRWL